MTNIDITDKNTTPVWATDQVKVIHYEPGVVIIGVERP